MSTASRRHDAAQRRAIWPPSPGFFQLRLVRRGWPVPARIVCDVEGWHAEIDGVASAPHDDPAHAPDVARVWHGGHRIAEADYRYLLDLKDWARDCEPGHPCLHPQRPIDPGLLPPILPVRSPSRTAGS
jgi:hypothetical protein